MISTALLVTCSILALKAIKKMQGKITWSGAPLAIIVYATLIVIKVIIETGLLFSAKGRLFQAFFDQKIVPEIIIGAFWLVFDLCPVMVVVFLHRQNFSSYGYDECVMICEMSEKGGSILSETMDPKDFELMMKGSVMSSLYVQTEHFSDSYMQCEET